MNEDIRWKDCPYQRYFHEQNLKTAASISAPSFSHEPAGAKSAAAGTPESAPPTFVMSSAGNMSSRTTSPSTAVSTVNNKIQRKPKLSLAMPPTPISPCPCDLESKLSPTSVAILNETVVYEEPSECNIEYDKKGRPRLTVLTTFRGGF